MPLTGGARRGIAQSVVSAVNSCQDMYSIYTRWFIGITCQCANTVHHHHTSRNTSTVGHRPPQKAGVSIIATLVAGGCGDRSVAVNAAMYRECCCPFSGESLSRLSRHSREVMGCCYSLTSDTTRNQCYYVPVKHLTSASTLIPHLNCVYVTICVTIKELEAKP